MCFIAFLIQDEYSFLTPVRGNEADTQARLSFGSGSTSAACWDAPVHSKTAVSLKVTSLTHHWSSTTQLACYLLPSSSKFLGLHHAPSSCCVPWFSVSTAGCRSKSQKLKTMGGTVTRYLRHRGRCLFKNCAPRDLLIFFVQDTLVDEKRCVSSVPSSTTMSALVFSTISASCCVGKVVALFV